MLLKIVAFQRKIVSKHPLVTAYLSFLKGVLVTVFVYEVLLK